MLPFIENSKQLQVKIGFYLRWFVFGHKQFTPIQIFQNTGFTMNNYPVYTCNIYFLKSKNYTTFAVAIKRL